MIVFFDYLSMLIVTSADFIFIFFLNWTFLKLM